MKTNHRLYENIIREHLDAYRQMVFLSGPRQVGKTTLGKTGLTGFATSPGRPVVGSYRW